MVSWVRCGAKLYRFLNFAPLLTLLGGISHFCSNFKRNFCKQTVENLIIRRVLRCLIWHFAVCRYPSQRTLCLNGLHVKRVFESQSRQAYRMDTSLIIICIH